MSITKAEKREKIREKAKNAPKGAKLAGQIQKIRTANKHAGKSKKKKK